jgi:hypothetical protein
MTDPLTFPRARQADLTVRELPEETLVYDQLRHRAHCLNATASLIWRHCDGRTSPHQLAALVADRLGSAASGAVVALALEQLGRRHLLEEAPPPLARADRMDRRDALKKVALLAVLPLVMTVATRTAAQSLSDGGGGSSDPPPKSSPTVQVNVGVTVIQQQAPPCRTKGQSCLASASGQQGTCCGGLHCNGVSQGAGVCG